ncbi:4Fe-4S binding protein [Skermanella stibiiresistens]|nr:4Fe-4S binding protein [Skermanella stibiiresistens]
MNGHTVLVCDCEGTMPLDGAKLAAACGSAGTDVTVATQLCRAQIDRFTAALDRAPGPVLVACTQEAPLFEETREDSHPDAKVGFLNIRERAGWSDEAADAHPKIAALIAEAALDLPSASSIELKSEGVALIYGRDELAIEVGRQLMDRLDITVLLTRPDGVIPPRTAEFPILKGTIAKASGHLGAFEIEVDDYALPLPSSRRALEFGPPRRGAKSNCDIILDLTGGTPLFPAHGKRDGYLRPDPGSPGEVQKAVFKASDLVGEFDKPRYIDFRADLCAHSRSRKTGCTRCLEVCPTGAITPAGDHVAIDPFVCAGCGSCAAVCPTGAATYTLPTPEPLLERLRTLLMTHHGAGGRDAVLLIHDGDHGDPLIDSAARFGAGLPARVIPFAVNSVTQLGIETLTAAFAYGVADLRVLVSARPREDMLPLARNLGLAETVLSGLGFGTGRVGLIEADDPDLLTSELYGMPRRPGVKPTNFLALGDKKGLSRLVLRKLHGVAPEPVPVLPLALGAPFGTLDIDAEGCTLCLSCVSVCPTGALSDNPDRPVLNFTEDACVQCGLCQNTCPEKVIRLRPQLDFTDAARSPIMVKEEEPCHCIRCGKAFGTKASIDRIVAKLAGKHWMFEDKSIIDRIHMCGDCRVIAQSQAVLDPYAGPQRPPTVTTDDYKS